MGKKLGYPEIERRQDILRSAINQSGEGITVIDLDGNLLYVNDAFAEMHGYSSKDIIGKHFSIFHTPEQMPGVDAANRHLREEGFFRGEIWHKRHDGSVFPTMMRNSLVRDDKGKPVAIIGTMRDITEQMRSEELLRESHGKLSAILTAIPDFMSIVDRDFNIIWANDTAKESFGDDIIGRKCYEAYRGSKTPCKPSDCMAFKVFEDKKPHVREIEVAARDGQKRYFHLTANAAFLDENGNPTGVMEISRDITDQKNAEKRQKFQRDLAVGLSNTTTLESTLEEILNHLLKLDEFDGGGIYLFNDETGSLEFKVFSGLPQQFVNDVKNYDSRDIRVEMILRGDPFFLPVNECPPYVKNDLKQHGFISLAVVPIKFRERVMGSINLASHTHDSVSDYSMSILQSVSDVGVGEAVARVIAEEVLNKTNLILEEKVNDRTAELNEKNVTLKILLEQRGEERSHLEDVIMSNVKKLVMPNINRLKNTTLSTKQQTALNILEANLNEIVSPFSKTIDSKYMKLTPTEIQVANYIKHGASSKEISDSLALSQRTVDTHRYNIRKKLGIRGKGVNLRTYLSSI